MMVGHFLVVDDLPGIAADHRALGIRQGVGCKVYQHRELLRHIGGQVAAVRAGVGTQLFLVEILQVIQRLLGGVP